MFRTKTGKRESRRCYSLRHALPLGRNHPWSRRAAFERLEEVTLLSAEPLLSSSADLLQPWPQESFSDSSLQVSTATDDSVSSLSTSSDVTIQPLATQSIQGSTGEKPQSKVWQHDQQWWTVFSDSTGTYIWRLDGTSWTPILLLSTKVQFKADVLPAGNEAHILLEKDSRTLLASIEYVPGAPGSYQLWSSRPTLVNIPLSSAETATIDRDTTGRMWLATESGSNVLVYHSDAPYSSWSGPVVLASDINDDDIAVVTALPGGFVGVFFSNQNTQRFGFRVHRDGDPADAAYWSTDEVPASQSALEIGSGMADDHLNVAVASDGTLYAAVKTSYNSASAPQIALLVRRPNGVWDPLYEVDQDGTRPVVLLNEPLGKLLVVFSSTESLSDIVYRETAIDTIAFGDRKTLITGAFNNASSTKHNVSDQAVVIASGNGVLGGALVNFPYTSPTTNQAPVVNAGGDLSVQLADAALLDAYVQDDGLPNPPGSVSVWWQKMSGPGEVTFGDAAAIDTTATFTAAGTYVLRLEASDGELSAYDEVTVSVVSPPATDVRFYLSLEEDGQVGCEGPFVANEDILAFDGSQFSLFFDGSDVGLGSLVLSAFTLLSPTEILMSFTEPATISGIGSVDDSDIVKFTATSLGENTAGTFEVYFRGGKVALSSENEDIDAVELLPDGRLLISTTGTYRLPVGSTTLEGVDEDIVAFTHTSLGENTSGSWLLYFDGSDQGLNTQNSEDLDGLAVDDQGRLYLSTTGNFAVSGLSGKNEDIFVFTPSSLGSNTAGTFDPQLFFDGSDFCLGPNDINDLTLPPSQTTSSTSTLLAVTALSVESTTLDQQQSTPGDQPAGNRGVKGGQPAAHDAALRALYYHSAFHSALSALGQHGVSAGNDAGANHDAEQDDRLTAGTAVSRGNRRR